MRIWVTHFDILCVHESHTLNRIPNVVCRRIENLVWLQALTPCMYVSKQNNLWEGEMW